jgi:hypothetical protein
VAGLDGVDDADHAVLDCHARAGHSEPGRIGARAFVTITLLNVGSSILATGTSSSDVTFGVACRRCPLRSQYYAGTLVKA